MGCRSTRLVVAILAVLAAASTPLARAQAPEAFPDVPPCHWAAEALDRIATPIDADEAAARASNRLAANAPRQVLEGMRCEDPAWSERFLIGAPGAWPPQIAVRAFELEVFELRRTGDEAEADVSLRVTLGDGTTLQRSGSVDLAFGGDAWRVAYASLADLDLPIFP